MQSLNTLFTKSSLASLVALQDLSSYDPVIRAHVSTPELLENHEVLAELYQFMVKHYRNEYVYQNTLLNKLLLGRHSTNTTTGSNVAIFYPEKFQCIHVSVYDIQSLEYTYGKIT